jgi:hypothetical protein
MMNELIEDYKRRVKSVNEMIELEEKAGTDTTNLMTLVRLKTKKGCYNAVITELERLAAQSANKDNTGYVIYDNKLKRYFGTGEVFTTKLKSAVIYDDKSHAESVLLMYSRKISDSFFAKTIEILPVVIELKNIKS